MKAIVLHGKDGNFRFEKDWPRPQVPEGWALIKVAYCGVCGSDIPRFTSAGSYHHPVILGHEFSGTVVEAKGNLFREGDSTVVLPIIPCGTCGGCLEQGPFHCNNYQFLGSRNDGGFAEYCAVPQTNLLKLESGSILKAGCLVEPMAVALHAIRRSGFRGGSAVVFGAGPIGLLTGLLLRELGAQKLVISDLREFSITTAKKMNFDVFNPTEINSSFCGQFDYAFECAGSHKALHKAVELLKGKGRLTVVGRDSGDTVIPRDIFEKLMRKELSLHGCWGYDIRGDEDLIVSVLTKHVKTLESLISHCIPVDDAENCIRDMCSHKLEYCKVAVSFN